jgi:predicted PurR-regulated permease PerM
MGNNLQLQPLTVLFSLMVGGQIGGIAGLYLSVPTVAVLRIVWLGCFPSDNPAEISEQPLAEEKA